LLISYSFIWNSRLVKDCCIGLRRGRGSNCLVSRNCLEGVGRYRRNVWLIRNFLIRSSRKLCLGRDVWWYENSLLLRFQFINIRSCWLLSYFSLIRESLSWWENGNDYFDIYGSEIYNSYNYISNILSNLQLSILLIAKLYKYIFLWIQRYKIES
jgi:hypothetical protein